MTTTHQSTRLHFVPRIATLRPKLAGMLLLGAALAWTSPSLAASDESAADCPLLPDLPGADIDGHARIVVHLLEERTLIEVDGRCYELGDRPLEVGLEDLDRLTVIVVPEPGLPVPTLPDIVIRPTEDDPEPS